MKKYIDYEKMPRKYLYNLFREMDLPYVGITANIDVTEVYNRCKQCQYSFFKTIMYLITKTCNSIKEFRYRFYEDKIVEYDIVHPSYTLMVKEDAFNYCTVLYTEDFQKFCDNAAAKEEKLQGNTDIYHEKDLENLIYLTCVPWVSFTDVFNPINIASEDASPRIAWGKYREEGDKLIMPVSVLANHAFIDGYHLGIFFKNLQTYCTNFAN